MYKLVLIRHGESTWNLENRFTGWTDVPLTETGIDRLFLTGGSSLIPAIRAIFERRFGPERIATGGELTSIAHGLALIGQEPDLAQWSA